VQHETDPLVPPRA